jgi:hypothetical protein
LALVAVVRSARLGLAVLVVRVEVSVLHRAARLALTAARLSSLGLTS